MYYNFQIPRGRSALSVAQSIRDNFFDGYREVEFVVVCDVKKENAQIIQELNDAQVSMSLSLDAPSLDNTSASSEW